MDRSSISSSKRAVGPPWALLLAIGLLALLEGTLRLVNPLGILASGEERELSYREVVPELRAFGAPEVTVVGSSRARRAVISPLLRSILRGEGVDVRVGNFALAGAEAEEIELVLRRVVEDPSRPKLLVWPISPRELEERGQRPVNTVRYLWRPADWWLARQELGSKADQYLPDALRNEVARHSWTMRYRFAMRDLAENPPRRGAARRLRQVIVPSPREATTKRGAIHPKHTGRSRNRSLDVDRRRVEDYVGEAYREKGWPRNYQAQHLDGAVRLVTAAGIPLVFIEIPTHPLLEDVLPAGTTLKFRKHMQSVAARHDVRFLSSPELDTVIVRQDFHEQSHLNYRGAEKFTRAIAPIVMEEL